MRLAPIDHRACGRTIAPRADRVKIVLQLVIVQLGRDVLPRQLRIPMRIQHLHHHQPDRDRVLAAPRPGAIKEQLELRRKRVLMRSDEQINPASVIVKSGAFRGRQVGVNTPGRQAKLQVALHFVVPHQRGTENLRQFPIGVAAESIHLPQPVLSGHIALRHKKIVLGSRLNVGHAVSITPD